MLVVQRAFATDGQADTMQRQRVVLANQAQVVMEGAAVHHVVLGMDLEETDVGPLAEHVLEVLGLEPQASTRRQAWRQGPSVVVAVRVQGHVHDRHSGRGIRTWP